MRKRILIVEDDPAISKLIDMNLALSGYQTVCAMDGKQAVDAIRAQEFDLALCDIIFSFLERISIWRNGALHDKIQEMASDCHQRRFIWNRRCRI